MKTLPFIYILLIFLLIFSADTNAFPSWLSWYRKIPFGDKIGHFLLFGIFSLSLNYICKFKQMSLFTAKLFFGSVFTFVFITIEEFSQIFFSSRTFSMLDLTANYFGILILGELTSRFIRNRTNKSVNQELLAVHPKAAVTSKVLP